MGTATTVPRTIRGRRPMTELRRTRLRLEISREAVRLFREQGVAATSGEQIADAVGLSGRTLWRYFRSKESCVEPLLTQTVDAFVEILRRWPADRSLEEHLLADHGTGGSAEDAEDADAALAVIGMSSREPALRAIWLVVYERAEAVLARVVADRLARSPGDLAVRVQAAALSAALRITTEELAAAVTAGTGPPQDAAARLSDAVHAATHGVLGDVRPDRTDSTDSTDSTVSTVSTVSTDHTDHTDHTDTGSARP